MGYNAEGTLSFGIDLSNLDNQQILDLNRFITNHPNNKYQTIKITFDREDEEGWWTLEFNEFFRDIEHADKFEEETKKVKGFAGTYYLNLGYLKNCWAGLHAGETAVSLQSIISEARNVIPMWLKQEYNFREEDLDILIKIY